jgi:hypothetical protein
MMTLVTKTAWMTLVTVLSVIRYFIIVPALVLIVPLSVMGGGFQGKEIFLHAVVALFVLKLETELFHFVLTDNMRADVERFGRVQVSEAQAKVNETSKYTSIVGFCTASIIPILCGWRLGSKASAGTALYDLILTTIVLLCNLTCLLTFYKQAKTAKDEASDASWPNRALGVVAWLTATLASAYGSVIIWSWLLDPVGGDSVEFFGTDLPLNYLIAAGITYIVATWSQITVNQRGNRAPLWPLRM